MTTPHPYINVHHKWNDELSAAKAAKRNWQVMSGIQGVAVVALVVGLIVVSRQSHLVPYVVQVDTIGRAVASGVVEPTTVQDEKIVRAHLYRFIENWRGIVTDVTAMRGSLGEAYKVVLPDVKDHILDPYYKENDAMAQASRMSRQIIPLSFLKQSDTSYLVEWKEVERDTSSQITGQSQWKALITIKNASPETLAKHVMYDPFNPLGMFISGLSWSEIH